VLLLNKNKIKILHLEKLYEKRVFKEKLIHYQMKKPSKKRKRRKNIKKIKN